MRKTTWLIFTVYFGLFVAFGFIFYYKYLDKFFKTGAEPETVETNSPSYIYYGIDNNLFRLKPQLSMEAQDSDRVERFQSTGNVQSLDVNTSGDLIAYEAQINGTSEIWQVRASTGESLKIASPTQSELSPYKNFTKPKISPKSSTIAFIGEGEQDAVFIFDSSKTYKNLTTKFVAKIADISWVDDQTLVFCTKEMPKNSCYSINTQDGSDQKVLSADVVKLSQASGGFIYLAGNANTANIFSFTLGNNKISPLTDLIAPKKVTGFSVDKNLGKLTFTVSDSTNSDIYFEYADGANRLQITREGKSIMSLIDPTGNQIAYLKPNDGIYIYSIITQKEQKIVNLKEQNIRLLIWR